MLRPYVREALNPEQLRRPPLDEWLERAARPEPRPPGHLVHQSVPQGQLACERVDVRLGGEEPVGAALHDEPVTPLGDEHAAGTPPGIEDNHLGPRPLELPRGGQPRQPCPHHRDRHTHPRAAVVSCAISASAPMSRGSSFKDLVRSRWTPRRAASARYTTSTSYNTSTWSHTNPRGTRRTAR